MPSAPPVGEPVPSDGALPASVLEGLAETPLSAYVHVPFCSTRCGYCDFNTYTPDQLGGATVEGYLDAVAGEIALSRGVLGDAAPALATVFFGGGTPTLLTARQLGGVLDRLRDTFGLAGDCEVTVEANPETITPELLSGLLDAGVNRLSMGMQSAVPSVLRVLDRVHTPGRALDAVRMARDTGFTDISLDLIYGTPGESLDQWRTSLDAAIGAGPDHISAYALIVEDGTRLAAQVRRGVLPAPDDDDLADKYLLADQVLATAEFEAYEVSNWARPGHPARHNLAYWLGHNWWGYGPGAHSHVGGVRWWNVRHPRSYAEAVSRGHSPGLGREILTPADRRVERVLLELRLSEGLPLSVLTASERGRVAAITERGLGRVEADRLSLTLRGRLLADAVIRDLLD